MSKAKTIAFVGLLVSMEIIFTRFLSFQTPIIRIGFGFIPIAFSAILFGPLIGGMAAAAADIIGMMIFPKGPYFPGFTLSAFLTGAIYGLFLYRNPVTIVNIAKSVLLITIFVDLGLNTLWLFMTTGEAAAALFIPRTIKSAIMLPVQVITINVLWKYIGSHINKSSYAKEH
ncbi:MAG TPA: folate family ECF transporter S component [Bacillota bacterium]|jgi:ECF transporter S component (folate family)|nr:folate family ECF transporter S component [Bacillota bacterium]HQI16606.1 folate family ECF transporter S component [Bacillota bacterium]HQJ37191.1 folate family ECF transporter S component [Bacillota bacterium]HQL35149.1 folate family ECF transporter S component [Bacillota bacterium]